MWAMSGCPVAGAVPQVMFVEQDVEVEVTQKGVGSALAGRDGQFVQIHLYSFTTHHLPLRLLLLPSSLPILLPL